MIYIHGDTHGYLSAFEELTPVLTKDDKLIITGDFGFVFHGGDADAVERNKLDELAKKPYEILFLDGNHENFPILETYPEIIRHGAPVRQLRPNIFWLQRGYVYTIEDKTFFVMGGGYSIDKARRMDYQRCSGQPVWFAEEMPSDEEYRRAIRNLEAHGMTVDYILTHTAPSGIIQQIICRPPDPHEAELNRFLDWIYYTATFKRWYFGHLHEDRNLYDLMIACYNDVHPLED